MIDFGYFENGAYAPGRYLVIKKDGRFWVGENSRLSEGLMCDKGIKYNTDGTSEFRER